MADDDSGGLGASFGNLVEYVDDNYERISSLQDSVKNVQETVSNIETPDLSLEQVKNVLPSGISNNLGVLETFARNPRAFVLGAILTTIVNGVEETLLAVLGAIEFVFEGDTVGSTVGNWGLADLPRVSTGWLLTASSGLAELYLDQLTALNESTLSSIGFAPGAPILVSALLAVEILVTLYVLRLLVVALLSFLQIENVVKALIP